MQNQNNPPELIRAALAYIPANLPRDEWARVAMAIKSEYPDETRPRPFHRLECDCRQLRPKGHGKHMAKREGGRRGGHRHTALARPKQGGLTLPSGTRQTTQRTAQHAEQKREADAQRERDRAANRERENAQREADHERAASDAATLWNEASDTGTSAYLERKGVQAHGLRFTPDGWALVPVRDAAGKLQNVQRIAPAKPTDGGPDKLFLKGGRKSGLWHMLGNPEGAPVVLVAEGYATAASVFEATGRPVAVAFDAGNLAPVAKILHSLWPRALIVIAGDDDRGTEAKTSKNPGRIAATAAARSAQGLAIFPEPLPEGGSDFNDLHHAAGLDAVRACIEGAIQAHQTARTAAQATQDSKQGKARPNPRNAPNGPNDEVYDPFTVDDSGVWHAARDQDGNWTPRRLCGRLIVLGKANNEKNDECVLLLEFDTENLVGRRWLMPLDYLVGEGMHFQTGMMKRGFITPTGAVQRRFLLEYIKTRQNLEALRHVPKVGWHGKRFVLPDETIGASPPGERVIFYSEAGIEARFGQRGTLDKWRQDLARLCVGNTRMAFAVSAAFAAPLLAWASGTGGGGFQITGTSSIGKTSSYLLAASVWGKGSENDPDSYIHKMRATSNGLEYLAEQHNDGLLILDEIGQSEASDIGQAVYMLADGSGKTRARAAGGLRQKATWQILFLVSGEDSLGQHMQTANKAVKSGMLNRLAQITGEVAPGTAFEVNHEFCGGHELAGWVKDRAARCYGAAGRAWIEHLISHSEGLREKLRELMDTIEAQLVPEQADGQAWRVGRRFALVAAGGELATQAGLTGWPPGEATRAVTACFEDWLVTRGGIKNIEGRAALDTVRSFIERNEEGRFSWWHRTTDDRVPKTQDRAGYRLIVDKKQTPVNVEYVNGLGQASSGAGKFGTDTQIEYLIHKDAFEKEVCKGIDYRFVARVLLECRCLIPDKGRPFDCSRKPPGSNSMRFYRISSEISTAIFV